MPAKDIISPEELKALLPPDEIRQLNEMAGESMKAHEGGADDLPSSELIGMVCSMQGQIRDLQARVQTLESMLMERFSANELAAASAEPVPGTPAAGAEENEDEAGKLVPRSVRHGKKKSGMRKFF
ncbi:hypothetical protein [Paenibacillus hamazuiensis]|uniref:hypothetical protein n=1 Tax=Paenibacillus hamazuiensis TaxID=2936508 RepID=UPI00200D9857|nr:hypothetical protein [Paenibacillus hamazuiensis]